MEIVEPCSKPYFFFFRELDFDFAAVGSIFVTALLLFASVLLFAADGSSSAAFVFSAMLKLPAPLRRPGIRAKPTKSALDFSGCSGSFLAS